jgi:AbiV family abortive infection protein
MARRRLTLQQIEDLYDALLANADRLCRDAELLMEAGSGGRARVLAILALEESAKAIACLIDSSA